MEILQTKWLMENWLAGDVKQPLQVTVWELNPWFNLKEVVLEHGSKRQQVQAMLRFLAVFLTAAGFVFGLLRSLDFALIILTCRRPLRCIGLGLVALGALAGFGVAVGGEGRLSPPGQALKTWTSFTLRPVSSGGLAQVARTFRLTFSIHLDEDEIKLCPYTK